MYDIMSKQDWQNFFQYCTEYGLFELNVQTAIHLWKKYKNSSYV
jgi:uncharacterized membrane protein